jgi:hypothetical protein
MTDIIVSSYNTIFLKHIRQSKNVLNLRLKKYIPSTQRKYIIQKEKHEHKNAFKYTNHAHLFPNGTIGVSYNNVYSLIAIWCEQGYIYLYDSKTFKQLNEYIFPMNEINYAIKYAPRNIIFSPDNKIAIILCQLCIVVLLLKTFKPIHIIDNFKYNNHQIFSCVQFNTTGEFVAIEMNDKIEIYDTQKGFILIDTINGIVDIINIKEITICMFSENRYIYYFTVEEEIDATTEASPLPSATEKQHSYLYKSLFGVVKNKPDK